MRFALLIALASVLAGCASSKRIQQLEQRQAELEATVRTISNTKVNERIVFHFDPPTAPEVFTPAVPEINDTRKPTVSAPKSGRVNRSATSTAPTPSRIEIVREIENSTVTESETKAKISEQVETDTRTKHEAGVNPLLWLLAGASLVLFVLVAILLRRR
jgi:hypothetical protein